MSEWENLRMQKFCMARVSICVSLAMGVVLGIGHGAAFAADAQKGKTGYVKHGCWQCHGFVGQGGIAGPKLAPEPMPLATLSAFVRNSRGAMPPYMEAVLSNEDLADIHAYLQSIPKAADYKSIPLLNAR
jgi:ubiquinol-cytochrome c reductase cytochrome c subunit